MHADARGQAGGGRKGVCNMHADAGGERGGEGWVPAWGHTGITTYGASEAPESLYRITVDPRDRADAARKCHSDCESCRRMGVRRIQPGGTTGCVLPAASGAAAEVTARRIRRDEGQRAGAKQRSRKQRSCCDALPSFILKINDHNERIAIDARTAVSRFMCGLRCEWTPGKDFSQRMPLITAIQQSL